MIAPPAFACRTCTLDWLSRSIAALSCAVTLLLSGPAVAADPIKAGLRADLAARIDARSSAVAVPRAEAIVTVVEYYHAGLKHFFMTADAAEIGNLDAGAFGGVWKRTGQTFGAWAINGRPADSSPVCRFFGTDKYRPDGTRIGANGHFYTADPAECAFVKTAWPAVAADGQSYPAWTYEIDAFAVKLPAAGACPAGTEPLYRAYNDGAGGDPNHRYVTDPKLLAGMPGWTFEGLVMCRAPAQSTIPVTVIGEIRGCDRPECRVPDAAGSGLGLVDVIVEVSATALPAFAKAGPAAGAATSITFEFPEGTVIVNIQGGPAGGSYQDGVLLDRARFEMKPWAQAPGTMKVMLSLYCMQQSRKPADTSAVYEMKGVTANPDLLAIINLPRPRPVVSDSITATVTQFAVWEVTDGKGSLTPAQLGQLRTLYSLEETDPAFAVLVESFLTSLSVFGPGG